MANKRIFYACQAVGIAPFTENACGGGADGSFVPAYGVQSVGVNTTFNLEQAFELGQISIYENIEGIPDVEVTIEKVLDGTKRLFELAAGTGTLVELSKKRCSVALSIFNDTHNAATGTPISTVQMSGMYISNVSYTLPADGNCTESVSLVGNSKIWLGTSAPIPSALWVNNAHAATGNKANTGGIQRREDVMMTTSIMPKDIPGVVGTSAGNNYDSTCSKPRAHIQNITISTDFGREDILELGYKEPYFKAPGFPIEVTSEFEIIATEGDQINVDPTADNLVEIPIIVVLRDGTAFNLGTKNKLASITYGGGDAGGGNATITYSYSTYNDLTISGP